MQTSRNVPYVQELEDQFSAHYNTPSDINEHLPTLRKYAAMCDHVTEFGTRGGVSTTALLAAQPSTLVCVDISHTSWVKDIFPGIAEKAEVNLKLVDGDSRDTEIEETDLLFIDTQHTADHLTAELQNTLGKVRKFIIIHDTETFGTQGEDGGEGLKYVIAEFCASNNWVVLEEFTNNHGLVVLASPEGVSASQEALGQQVDSTTDKVEGDEEEKTDEISTNEVSPKLPDLPEEEASADVGVTEPTNPTAEQKKKAATGKKK